MQALSQTNVDRQRQKENVCQAETSQRNGHRRDGGQIELFRTLGMWASKKEGLDSMGGNSECSSVKRQDRGWRSRIRTLRSSQQTSAT